MNNDNSRQNRRDNERQGQENMGGRQPGMGGMPTPPMPPRTGGMPTPPMPPRTGGMPTPSMPPRTGGMPTPPMPPRTGGMPTPPMPPRTGGMPFPPMPPRTGGMPTPPMPPRAGGQPMTPPPNFTPEQPRMERQPMGRGPEGFGEPFRGGMHDERRFRGCLNRFTYIWLVNGNAFWFFPINIGRFQIEGFRWRGNSWVYDRINLRRILFFRCF